MCTCPILEARRQFEPTLIFRKIAPSEREGGYAMHPDQHCDRTLRSPKRVSRGAAARSSRLASYLEMPLLQSRGRMLLTDPGVPEEVCPGAAVCGEGKAAEAILNPLDILGGSCR